MTHDSGDAEMETGTRYHGSLVAFEGPADVISTQLRLLPTSSQVLILPSVQHYMTNNDSEARFNARSYIKDIHQAVLARRDVALQFLNGSSKDNKRLVFLNGGTAGAVSNCISTISDRQASGDVLGAEAIFRDLVSEGARGLDHEDKYSNPDALGILSGNELPWEDDDEDPITKAMRAADALYKETESLQPIDCYIRSRPRSLSLPMLPYLDSLGEVSPCFVIGSPENEDARSVLGSDEEGSDGHVKGTGENLGRLRTLRNLQGVPRLKIPTPVSNQPPSFAGEIHKALNMENRSTAQPLSPTADHVISPPLTPEGVVYGEARMVQMHASRSQETLRKTRSLDDMDLVEARSRRASVQVDLMLKVASPTESPEAKSRHLSIVEDPYSNSNLFHLPEARFVKAQTTTIRRSPIYLKPLPELSRDSYVHQGTDAAAFGEEEEEEDESNSSFEPVLPIQEDLVIHFTNDAPDYVLDSVIQSFKDGSYPITSNFSGSHTAETDSCPSTPRTADLFDLEDNQVGLSPVAEVASADEASDYDPYVPQSDDARSSYLVHQPLSPLPPLKDSHEPLTPAETPTMPGQEPDSKFHELSTRGRANAVATQNALRLVLEVYFPPHQDGGYHQFNSALLHGLDSLWRPIFGDSETPGGKSSEKAADLILAIGCQKGVKREFLLALTGQIEKLGSKSSGLSRSGRLDLRYDFTRSIAVKTSGSLC